MNRSDTIGKLAKALSLVQGELRAATKGAENSYYSSAYADLPAVMEVCREALSKHEISVVQAHDFGVDVWGRNGDVQELKSAGRIWIETVLMHSSGEWISGRYPVNPVKSDPQSMGSATTYARRYALMSMLGIVAENEDDDGNAASGISSEPVKNISPKQKARDEGNKAQAEAATSRADQWGYKILDQLVNAKSMDEYRSIMTEQNERMLEKLKSYNGELYNGIKRQINELLDRFNPLNA